MLKRIRFYVGTQTGDGPVSDHALNSVRDELVTLFGGLTEENARGFWHGAGKLWDEPSVLWTVFVDPGKYWNHREYAQRLCTRLGQECVLVETAEGGELIYAPSAS